MSKNKLITLSLSAILLSGCSLLPKSISIDSSQSPAQQAASAARLADIMQKGGSASCTITDLESQSTTKMAVSGKKMKVTGTSIQDSKSGTYLTDGTYVYMWSDGEKTGFKMKLPDPEEAKKTAQEAKKAAADYDPDTYTSMYENEAKFKMDCKEGAVSDSEFTPPADVTFTDFQSMMQESLKAIPSLPKMDY